MKCKVLLLDENKFLMRERLGHRQLFGETAYWNGKYDPRTKSVEVKGKKYLVVVDQKHNMNPYYLTGKNTTFLVDLKTLRTVNNRDFLGQSLDKDKAAKIADAILNELGIFVKPAFWEALLVWGKRNKWQTLGIALLAMLAGGYFFRLIDGYLVAHGIVVLG